MQDLLKPITCDYSSECKYWQDILSGNRFFISRLNLLTNKIEAVNVLFSNDIIEIKEKATCQEVPNVPKVTGVDFFLPRETWYAICMIFHSPS